MKALSCGSSNFQSAAIILTLHHPKTRSTKPHKSPSPPTANKLHLPCPENLGKATGRRGEGDTGERGHWPKHVLNLKYLPYSALSKRSNTKNSYRNYHLKLSRSKNLISLKALYFNEVWTTKIRCSLYWGLVNNWRFLTEVSLINRTGLGKVFPSSDSWVGSPHHLHAFTRSFVTMTYKMAGSS